MLHYRAWEMGIKSLYYLRSKAIQRAGFPGGVEADNTAEAPKFELAAESTDFDECLACQYLDTLLRDLAVYFRQSPSFMIIFGVSPVASRSPSDLQAFRISVGLCFLVTPADD